MAKKPTLKSITSGYASGTQLEFNFDAIETAFENTLSLDGSTPNAMTADLDMNSNDILNVATLSVTGLTVNGVDISTSVASAATNATAAAASATAAATSETNAAASAAAAQAVEDLLPDWQGAWLTATAYATGDLVREDGSTYICLVAHTSGTFSTDLSASKWELFAQKGAAGAGTGDMLAANNLSDVVSAAASRSNLGLGSIATQDSTAVVVGSGGGSVANSLTITTAGHVTDGGNDYGVTIHSYEPALCLVDRTVSGGSALVWGTETGGLRIMGDTTQDGSIGQTANATDYDLVKFEKSTHTSYINGASKMVLTSAGLNIAGTGAISGISTDDTLSSDSDTLVPSQSAVKGYVDGAVLQQQRSDAVIATGSIDATGKSFIRLDTEGAAATDTLNYILGGVDGQRLVLCILSNSRTITLTHGAGAIDQSMRLAGGVNMNITSNRTIIELIFNDFGAGSSGWHEISRSVNS